VATASCLRIIPASIIYIVSIPTASLNNQLETSTQPAVHLQLRKLRYSDRFVSFEMSRDTSVGIAVGCTTGVRFPAGATDFSVLHSVQTGSGANPASDLMGTGGLFPLGLKRSGRAADHSPQSSAEVKNGGPVPPLTHTSSWHGT
jgi:hypothetical protein